MELSQLLDICNANGLHLDEAQTAQLVSYANMLQSWNAKINLISRKDEANILERHILHSLTLAMPTVCDFDFVNKHIADVGTGGGLPGIPLKIVMPFVEITLIDSIQKKILTCEDMISELNLIGIYAARGRVEVLSHDPTHYRQYDAVVSRAAASLDDLATWCRGLLKSGGILLTLKGGELDQEIAFTKKLPFVKTIDVRPLELTGYNGFATEAKKLVTVSL